MITYNEAEQVINDLKRGKIRKLIIYITLTLGSLVSVYFLSTPNNSIKDSPGGVLIGGNNAGDITTNINMESKYLWANQKNWVASPLNQETDKHLVKLVFISEGPVIPVTPCLYIKSDVEVAGAGPIGASTTLAQQTISDVYIECFGGLASTITFQVSFYDKPKTLEAILIQNDSLLSSVNSGEPHFMLPVTQ